MPNGSGHYPRYLHDEEEAYPPPFSLGPSEWAQKLAAEAAKEEVARKAKLAQHVSETANTAS